MNHNDQEIVRAWADRQVAGATIVLARGNGGAAEPLERFCDMMASLAPGLEIENAADDSFRAPALIIGRHGNIAYQLIPEGPELPPFLAALTAAATGSPPPLDLSDLAALVELPAELILYVAPQCPHCPGTASQMLDLAAATPKIRLVVVDALLFSEQAAAHGIRSVPTVLLEDQMRWSGAIDRMEVMRHCIHRDPSRLSAAGLRRIIETGEAPRAAAMMTAHGALFPSLLELLTHERWPVRLGAMVTVEYLSDDAPEVAAQLVEPLWERFGALSAPVQGDVVQVLGQVPGEAAIQCLRAIAAGEYATDVTKAAQEELADRQKG